jgi:NADH-quinone oxidoreductase subunit N
VAGVEGIPAVWFYVSTYAVQLVAAFTVVSVVSGPKSGASPLDDYNGLATRSPVLAASLALMMLAMGGIPFTTGFVGKFSVFTVAINSGYLWLAITGLVSSVAGLFFYLRVVVRMYIEQPVLAAGPGTMRAEPHLGWTARTVLGISVAVTLILGIAPWPLLNWVRNALPL